MGLFTTLSLEEARRLGAEFGVEVSAVEPLLQGSVNSNFRLRSSDGSTFFGRIYEEQGHDGASAELVLLTELARAGVPTTRPLAPTNGQIATIEGKPFALYPWI